MFSIYFPGAAGYSDDHLRGAGLGDLLDDVAPSWHDFLPGPDGGAGVACAWATRPILSGEFEWQKQPAGYWLGKAAGETPRPAWFARARQQLGADVVLADGHAWQIPIARQLPEILRLDAGGQWRGAVAPAYKAFYDLAWKALDWFVADASGTMWVSYQDGADFIAQALAVNYRITRELASWLGLIRSDLFWPVARVVTEFDELLAGAQKKIAAAGPLTSAGGAG